MAHLLSEPRIEHPIWLEPDDISYLRAQMSRIEAELKSLEKEINKRRMNKLGGSDYRLETQLKRQRDAKIVGIARVRSILSPIRRVPLEILGEIFVLSCLPKGRQKPKINALQRDICAICSVCIAWRIAAHATPRLWSTLQYSLESDHSKNRILWFRQWLERARGFPLDLHLHLFYTSSRDTGRRQLLDHVSGFPPPNSSA
ncbi:hypothetical protein BT96DRAFT_998646 [Gymnopus androsaceus JB14]|uniref:Uncharacterized protein n=1 Tax=Gymnopus androsaceus JB14 TaxID=1447944 RepID=A0A6A4H8Y2_9AGAR|nr:hypothetical protein BT96DRAFT_998646 [Gymnopus androsaceus JB14]